MHAHALHRSLRQIEDYPVEPLAVHLRPMLQLLQLARRSEGPSQHAMRRQAGKVSRRINPKRRNRR